MQLLSPDVVGRKLKPDRPGLVLSHWRGQLALPFATALPCLLLAVLWAMFRYVFGKVDWVWHHQAAALTSAALISAMLAAATWGLLGVLRSARRADREGVSSVLVHSATATVFVVAVLTAGNFAFATRLWLGELWDIARDRIEKPELTVSGDGKTLMFDGKFVFGATRAVRDALDRNPGITRVELSSRGGIAQEGIGLGKLIADRRLATLVTKECASACVTAFAGGAPRLLGPAGRLALHSASRGGFDWTPDVDALHAEFLASRGVDVWLIEQEKSVAFEDIWIPSQPLLLESGLVNDVVDAAPV